MVYHFRKTNNKEKMRTILYLILLGILITFSIQSCSKDEEVPEGNPEVITKDSMSLENRNGTTSAIYYMDSNSLTYHQKLYQMAFNKDSIVSTTFVRTSGPTSENYTKVLGTLDPTYTNKPGRKYDITINLTNGVYLLPSTWIKDTSAISFTKVGNINLFPGKNKVYRTDRTDNKKNYYDTDYKKSKSKFEYIVTIDTTIDNDFIQSNNTGNIFWINHKM